MRESNHTPPASGRVLTTIVLLSSGAFMLLTGVWALVAPDSFAGFAGFPPSRHFVHDAGAFQIGLGVGLILATSWADAAATTLAGFFVANTIHAANHFADPSAKDQAADAWILVALSLLVLAALIQRLRALGFVVGEVSPSADPELAPFSRQKTVLLTSYKRDGSPVDTPVSVAVDGERAFVRSYAKAWKVRRIGHNPDVDLAPCTTTGRPTGPPIRLRARLITGQDARHAACLLERKHPFLHRFAVPAAHRLGRARTGRTVYFELSLPGRQASRPSDPAVALQP